MHQQDLSALCFAFSEFRLSRSMLECKGERVPLSPKALDTLFALVQRAGEVVDKEALMQQVWGRTPTSPSPA